MSALSCPRPDSCTAAVLPFFELKTVGAFDLARLLEGQQLAPNAAQTHLQPRRLRHHSTPRPAPPLELAQLLGGPAPISCIRVRVAGIETMNEDARASIQALAQ